MPETTADELNRQYEQLKSQATLLANEGDVLGEPLSRLLDLMNTIRSGATQQSITHKADSLKAEVDVAKRHDQYSNTQLRSLIYGVCANVAGTIALEQRTAPPRKNTAVKMELMDTSEDPPAPSAVLQFPTSRTQTTAVVTPGPIKTQPLAHTQELHAAVKNAAHTRYPRRGDPVAAAAAEGFGRPVPSTDCSVCGRVFASSGGLMTHMGTHVAKVRCALCGKSFRPNLMDRHLQTKHNQRP